MSMLSTGKTKAYPTQTVTDKTNPWVEYFGEPLREYRTTADAHQTFDRYDLPEAYKGKNLYLADTLEGFILREEDLLWTRQILPLVRTDQLSVQFNTWRFAETLAGRVPHEGISRIIQSQKSQTSGAMERRGLAFILEHGFMKTDEGRRQYMLNIQQIVQAVQVTLNFDVLSALLTCKRYDIQWLREHGYFREFLPEIMKREISMFGIIQKDVNGFDIVVEEYKKQMRDYNVAPDALILPSKLQMYIPMVPQEKILYSNRGKLGVDQFEAGPIKSYRQLKIYEAKAFDLGNGERPVNLMASAEQIGQHNIMAMDEHVDPEQYESEQRDILIYDADTDRYERVSFLDAVKNSMRFGSDGKTAKSHDNFMAENPHLKQHKDVFLYEDDQDGRWKKASLFGHLHKDSRVDYLSKSMITKVVCSAKHNLPPRVIAAFEDGCALIEEKKRTVQKGKLYVDMLEFAKATDKDGERARNFLGALEKIHRLLKQAFPTAALLNFKNIESPDAEGFSLTEALGVGEGASAVEKQLAAVYLALFGDYKERLTLDTDSESSYDIFETGSTSSSVPVPVPVPVPVLSEAPLSPADLAKMHDMNVSALGHSKALDSKFYTDAVARYEPGSEMHRKLVTGVAHLINKHVDNMEDKVFTNTYGMLSKVNGRPSNDRRQIQRMGLVPDKISSTKPPAAKTTGDKDKANSNSKSKSTLPRSADAQQYVLHPGSATFIGSPLHMMLTAAPVEGSEDGEDAEDGSMVAKAASIFSRRKKKRRKAAAAIGSFADLAHVSTDEAALEFSTKNFVDRMEMVDQMAEGLDRFIGMALLTSTTSLETIESMHANNIIVPVDVLLVRPFIEFEMNHGLLVKSGRETGATFIGHSDFQLGDDVQTKLHYGNYTFYAKALVGNNKNVVILKNIFINNYLGGFNTQFWHAENGALEDKHDEIFTLRKRPSMFAMLIPCGSANHRTVLGADPVDVRSALPYYAHVLKLDNLEDPPYDEDFFEPNSQSNMNSMCYQGKQFSYDQATRRFSKLTLGGGHLGRNVYPGVREVYQGSMKYMEKLGPSSTY